MIKAIYVLREDGDYDFAMAFDIDKLDIILGNESADSVIDEYVTAFENEGEEVWIIKFGGTSEIVDVLEDN